MQATDQAEATAGRNFGPCSKCGGFDILVQYHVGQLHCADCEQIESCHYSEECGKNGKAGEHLRVHCRRCQYGWLEDVESPRSVDADKASS